MSDKDKKEKIDKHEMLRHKYSEIKQSDDPAAFKKFMLLKKSGVPLSLDTYFRGKYFTNKLHESNVFRQIIALCVKLEVLEKLLNHSVNEKRIEEFSSDLKQLEKALLEDLPRYIELEFRNNADVGKAYLKDYYKSLITKLSELNDTLYFKGYNQDFRLLRLTEQLKHRVDQDKLLTSELDDEVKKSKFGLAGEHVNFKFCLQEFKKLKDKTHISAEDAGRLLKLLDDWRSSSVVAYIKRVGGYNPSLKFNKLYRGELAKVSKDLWDALVKRTGDKNLIVSLQKADSNDKLLIVKFLIVLGLFDQITKLVSAKKPLTQQIKEYEVFTKSLGRELLELKEELGRNDSFQVFWIKRLGILDESVANNQFDNRAKRISRIISEKIASKQSFSEVELFDIYNFIELRNEADSSWKADKIGKNFSVTKHRKSQAEIRFSKSLGQIKFSQFVRSNNPALGVLEKSEEADLLRSWREELDKTSKIIEKVLSVENQKTITATKRDSDTTSLVWLRFHGMTHTSQSEKNRAQVFMQTESDIFQQQQSEDLKLLMQEPPFSQLDKLIYSNGFFITSSLDGLFAAIEKINWVIEDRIGREFIGVCNEMLKHGENENVKAIARASKTAATEYLATALMPIRHQLVKAALANFASLNSSPFAVEWISKDNNPKADCEIVFYNRMGSLWFNHIYDKSKAHLDNLNKANNSALSLNKASVLGALILKTKLRESEKHEITDEEINLIIKVIEKGYDKSTPQERQELERFVTKDTLDAIKVPDKAVAFGAIEDRLGFLMRHLSTYEELKKNATQLEKRMVALEATKKDFETGKMLTNPDSKGRDKFGVMMREGVFELFVEQLVKLDRKGLDELGILKFVEDNGIDIDLLDIFTTPELRKNQVFSWFKLGRLIDQISRAATSRDLECLEGAFDLIPIVTDLQQKIVAKLNQLSTKNLPNKEVANQLLQAWNSRLASSTVALLQKFDGHILKILSNFNANAGDNDAIRAHRNQLAGALFLLDSKGIKRDYRDKRYRILFVIHSLFLSGSVGDKQLVPNADSLNNSAELLRKEIAELFGHLGEKNESKQYQLTDNLLQYAVQVVYASNNRFSKDDAVAAKTLKAYYSKNPVSLFVEQLLRDGFCQNDKFNEKQFEKLYEQSVNLVENERRFGSNKKNKLKRALKALKLLVLGDDDNYALTNFENGLKILAPSGSSEKQKEEFVEQFLQKIAQVVYKNNQHKQLTGVAKEISELYSQNPASDFVNALMATELKLGVADGGFYKDGILDLLKLKAAHAKAMNLVRHGVYDNKENVEATLKALYGLIVEGKLADDFTPEQISKQLMYLVPYDNSDKAAFASKLIEKIAYYYLPRHMSQDNTAVVELVSKYAPIKHKEINAVARTIEDDYKKLFDQVHNDEGLNNFVRGMLSKKHLSLKQLYTTSSTKNLNVPGVINYSLGVLVTGLNEKLEQVGGGLSSVDELILKRVNNSKQLNYEFLMMGLVIAFSGKDSSGHFKLFNAQKAHDKKLAGFINTAEFINQDQNMPGNIESHIQGQYTIERLLGLRASEEDGYCVYQSALRVYNKKLLLNGQRPFNGAKLQLNNEETTEHLLDLAGEVIYQPYISDDVVRNILHYLSENKSQQNVLYVYLYLTHIYINNQGKSTSYSPRYQVVGDLYNKHQEIFDKLINQDLQQNDKTAKLLEQLLDCCQDESIVNNPNLREKLLSLNVPEFTSTVYFTLFSYYLRNPNTAKLSLVEGNFKKLSEEHRDSLLENLEKYEAYDNLDIWPFLVAITKDQDKGQTIRAKFYLGRLETILGSRTKEYGNRFIELKENSPQLITVKTEKNNLGEIDGSALTDTLKQGYSKLFNLYLSDAYEDFFHPVIDRAIEKFGNEQHKQKLRAKTVIANDQIIGDRSDAVIEQLKLEIKGDKLEDGLLRHFGLGYGPTYAMKTGLPKILTEIKRLLDSKVAGNIEIAVCMLNNLWNKVFAYPDHKEQFKTQHAQGVKSFKQAFYDYLFGKNNLVKLLRDSRLGLNGNKNFIIELSQYIDEDIVLDPININGHSVEQKTPEVFAESIVAYLVSLVSRTPFTSTIDSLKNFINDVYKSLSDEAKSKLVGNLVGEFGRQLETQKLETGFRVANRLYYACRGVDEAGTGMSARLAADIFAVKSEESGKIFAGSKKAIAALKVVLNNNEEFAKDDSKEFIKALIVGAVRHFEIDSRKNVNEKHLDQLQKLHGYIEEAKKKVAEAMKNGLAEQALIERLEESSKRVVDKVVEIKFAKGGQEEELSGTAAQQNKRCDFVVDQLVVAQAMQQVLSSQVDEVKVLERQIQKLKNKDEKMKDLFERRASAMTRINKAKAILKGPYIAEGTPAYDSGINSIKLNKEDLARHETRIQDESKAIHKLTADVSKKTLESYLLLQKAYCSSKLAVDSEIAELEVKVKKPSGSMTLDEKENNRERLQLLKDKRDTEYKLIARAKIKFHSIERQLGEENKDKDLNNVDKAKLSAALPLLLEFEFKSLREQLDKKIDSLNNEKNAKAKNTLIKEIAALEQDVKEFAIYKKEIKALSETFLKYSPDQQTKENEKLARMNNAFFTIIDGNSEQYLTDASVERISQLAQLVYANSNTKYKDNFEKSVIQNVKKNLMSEHAVDQVRAKDIVVALYKLNDKDVNSGILEKILNPVFISNAEEARYKASSFNNFYAVKEIADYSNLYKDSQNYFRDLYVAYKSNVQAKEAVSYFAAIINDNLTIDNAIDESVSAHVRTLFKAIVDDLHSENRDRAAKAAKFVKEVHDKLQTKSPNDKKEIIGSIFKFFNNFSIESVNRGFADVRLLLASCAQVSGSHTYSSNALAMSGVSEAQAFYNLFVQKYQGNEIDYFQKKHELKPAYYRLLPTEKDVILTSLWELVIVHNLLQGKTEAAEKYKNRIRYNFIEIIGEFLPEIKEDTQANEYAHRDLLIWYHANLLFSNNLGENVTINELKELKENSLSIINKFADEDTKKKFYQRVLKQLVALRLRTDRKKVDNINMALFQEAIADRFNSDHSVINNQPLIFDLQLIIENSKLRETLINYMNNLDGQKYTKNMGNAVDRWRRHLARKLLDEHHQDDLQSPEALVEFINAYQFVYDASAKVLDYNRKDIEDNYADILRSSINDLKKVFLEQWVQAAIDEGFAYKGQADDRSFQVILEAVKYFRENISDKNETVNTSIQGFCNFVYDEVTDNANNKLSESMEQDKQAKALVQKLVSFDNGASLKGWIKEASKENLNKYLQSSLYDALYKNAGKKSFSIVRKFVTYTTILEVDERKLFLKPEQQKLVPNSSEAIEASREGLVRAVDELTTLMANSDDFHGLDKLGLDNDDVRKMYDASKSLEEKQVQSKQLMYPIYRLDTGKKASDYMKLKQDEKNPYEKYATIVRACFTYSGKDKRYKRDAFKLRNLIDIMVKVKRGEAIGKEVTNITNFENKYFNQGSTYLNNVSQIKSDIESLEYLKNNLKSHQHSKTQ